MFNTFWILLGISLINLSKNHSNGFEAHFKSFQQPTSVSVQPSERVSRFLVERQVWCSFRNETKSSLNSKPSWKPNSECTRKVDRKSINLLKFHVTQVEHHWYRHKRLWTMTSSKDFQEFHITTITWLNEAKISENYSKQKTLWRIFDWSFDRSQNKY